jgi:CO/xanthine dehydrogenase FAD-binding subunit
MSRTIAYHRPFTLEEAVGLLESEGEAPRVLLGGGTIVNTGAVRQEVIDLQALGLNGINDEGGSVIIGAMATLQAVADDAAVPEAVREAAKAELPSTLRTVSTVGGTVGARSGESRLLATLLAFGGEVSCVGSAGPDQMPLATWLESGSGIITSITVESGGVAATAVTGRTPADVPIVAAVAHSSVDGVSLALTGVATTPVLVDPTSPTEGLTPFADFRGSIEYRLSVAATLSARVLAEVQA